MDWRYVLSFVHRDACFRYVMCCMFLPFLSIYFLRIFGGASKRDYEVLRFSNAIWETIPFADNPQQPVDAVENQPSTSPNEESTTTTSERPSSPEPPTDISIQTCNTLSSLR